jgi:hypothetical protein
MVQDVEGTIDDGDVPFPVDIVEHPPRHLSIVMHVHLAIDHYDALAELHLARPPQGVHDLAGLHRIALLDRYQHTVVEAALLGQVHVHHLGQSEAEEGQEQAFCGLAQMRVLHGSLPHDGGGIDGVPPVGDGGHVEHRIVVCQRVVAGVVTERSFPSPLFQVKVALEDDLGMSRNLEVDRLGLDHLHRPTPQEPGEGHLVDHGGERGGGGVGESGIGPDGDCRLHAAARLPVVLGGVFVDMPMHAGGVAVEHLQTVHAHVPAAGLGMAGEDQGQGDVAAGVERPTLQDGQRPQIDLGPGVDHLLAGASAHSAWLQGRQVLKPEQSLDLVHSPLRQLHGHQLLHPTGQLRVGLRPQGLALPLGGAELIDEDGDGVADRPGEEQSRPARFYHPVGYLADLEHRVDRRVDDLEPAPGLQGGYEVAQVVHASASASR